MQEYEQTEAFDQDESHTDSIKLKLGFTERVNARLKEENYRLTAKIGKLEDHISGQLAQQQMMKDTMLGIEIQLKREKAIVESLEMRLQVRQERHVSQQSQYLTKNEKDILVKQLKQKDDEIMVTKSEVDGLMKQCHNLMLQLQTSQISRVKLENEVQILLKSEQMRIIKQKEIESLMNQKIRITEGQNTQLKKQVESLILEVNLFEKQHQIQGLLKYQKDIGNQWSNRAAPSVLQPLTRRVDKSQHKGTTYSEAGGELEYYCAELKEQVDERQELIQLLREKNKRMLCQMQALKKRCSNLQNIICSSSI